MMKVTHQDQYSWLNLTSLNKEISRTHIYMVNSDYAIVGSCSRTGSVYVTYPSAVLINYGILKQDVSLFAKMGEGAMLLHEFLGANGYPDDLFEISSVLALMTISQDGGDAHSHLEILGKRLVHYLETHRRLQKNIKVAAGGATSTGGGGDPWLALLKMLMLNRAMSNPHCEGSRYAGCVDSIMNADLEPESCDRPSSSKHFIVHVPLSTLHSCLSEFNEACKNTFIALADQYIDHSMGLNKSSQK